MPHPLIRDVVDFPQPGVTFKDITPLLGDPAAFAEAVEGLATLAPEAAAAAGGVDKVVGLEARGFIFGAPVALRLEAGFVPMRKAGKLPHETRALTYDLEYGTETVELHLDAAGPGERVLVVDDVLATGGTARAAVDLVRAAGAEVVGVVVLMELAFLEGRSRLHDVPVHALHVVDAT